MNQKWKDYSMLTLPLTKLVGFYDATHVNNLQNRQSINAVVFTFIGGTIIYKSKTQTLMYQNSKCQILVTLVTEWFGICRQKLVSVLVPAYVQIYGTTTVNTKKIPMFGFGEFFEVIMDQTSKNNYPMTQYYIYNVLYANNCFLRINPATPWKNSPH